MTHEIKILPKFYNAILCGDKNFDIRKNDRNYQKDDRIVFCEWNEETNDYTGRQIRCYASYIMKGSEKTEHLGLKKGYCIIGFKEV